MTKSHPTNVIKLKLVTVGDCASGKTCIIKRYCEKRFVRKYSATIGIDFGVSKCRTDNLDIRLNIFDTAGHSAFYEIRKDFYRNSNIVILVFDVNKRTSFLNLPAWLEEFNSEHEQHKRTLSPVFFLLGNKIDKSMRMVDSREAKMWAFKRGMSYFEVSANTGYGIEHVFQIMLTHACDVLLGKSKPSPISNVYERCPVDDMLNNNNQEPNIFFEKYNFPDVYLNQQTFRFSETTHHDPVKRILHGRDDHEKLGLRRGASKEEVTKAYRKLAFLLHPDKTERPGSEEAFKQLVASKNALLDKFK